MEWEDKRGSVRAPVSIEGRSDQWLRCHRSVENIVRTDVALIPIPIPMLPSPYEDVTTLVRPLALP